MHERAHLVVVDGEVEVDADGTTVRGGPGFARRLRSRTSATRSARPQDARLLLVLAPWPGDGPPGRRDD